MNNIRVIARLDIKGPNLVKGIHLEGLRVLGNPEDFAKYYYEQGADELIYQDVVASLFERNSLSDIITQTAKNIFIPLTVGGGIRTIEDITKVLRAGADKVAINTAAVRNPDFIRQASKKFGSSTIVAAIECIKQPDGKYLAFVDNGREETGIEALSWAQRVEELGAGEILLTSVDRDGTGLGYDVALTRMIAAQVSVPVIAHGGAGSINHFSDVVSEGKADAIAVASVIHYDALNNNVANNGKTAEGNKSFINSGRTSFNKISGASIGQIKAQLTENNIACRTL
ncbi:imidazole glycerol phosphate synthase subunit HisF [Taibaiella chishuiensis]|uniref:imidazole glycerol-phosphate synthase n=1 Tax=Taibaiella chishuiensis TaxID=1434707 RepID=A0A2P8DB64_9BACT|nr:imidazole glycerol phosphate synthase cyclase subunit [Taibaiella chishuiensis]PSK94449.1 cyclase [Taibaiella chishuiensis]